MRPASTNVMRRALGSTLRDMLPACPQYSGRGIAVVIAEAQIERQSAIMTGEVRDSENV